MFYRIKATFCCCKYNWNGIVVCLFMRRSFVPSLKCTFSNESLISWDWCEYFAPTIASYALKFECDSLSLDLSDCRTLEACGRDCVDVVSHPISSHGIDWSARWPCNLKFLDDFVMWKWQTVYQVVKRKTSRAPLPDQCDKQYECERVFIERKQVFFFLGVCMCESCLCFVRSTNCQMMFENWSETERFDVEQMTLWSVCCQTNINTSGRWKCSCRSICIHRK